MHERTTRTTRQRPHRLGPKRLAPALAVLVAALLSSTVVQAHGTGAVTADNMIFHKAMLIQAPFVSSAPTPDGEVAASEWPEHSLYELDGGASFHVAHDNETLFVALDYPGSGWAAVAWSEIGEGPAQVVSMVMDNGTLAITDAYAENLTAELENEPDADVNGTSEEYVAGARAHDGRTTVELALPLETGDAYDPPLDIGAIHTFAVAYNETDTESPHTLDEGAEMFFRIFLDRPQDSSAEIGTLFASQASPVPALIAVVALGVALTWMSLPMLRRRAP